MPVTLPTTDTQETAWRLDLLQWQIESQFYGVRRSFYGNLLNLHADIGRICNKLIDNHKADPDLILPKISKQLSAQYGRLFEFEQLKQIVLFAQQYQPYPSTEGHDLFHFNWDYLAVLLQLPNREEQHFYMRATATKQWSVAELKQHIAADDYRNPKVFKALKKAQSVPENETNEKDLLKRQRSFWKLYKDFRSMPFPNPFVEPALSDYKRLLQPQLHEPKLSYQRFNECSKADDLDSIPLQVIKFREQVDRDFNSTFNHFLWNLGDLLTLPAGVKDALSDKLQELYGDFFDANLIDLIKTYHNRITDRDMEQRLGAILTWGHIILLLPLQNREEQLFYAELAHEQDLSPAELQKCIESEWYEQALADYNRNHPVFTTDDAPYVKKREKKVKGNKTLVVEYKSVDVDDLRPYHHNLNTLQNPCFMRFMAMPLR